MHDGGQVFGTAVLVFQVVGVFPDVDAEHRLTSSRKGGVLIGRGIEDQVAGAVDRKPGPAAAEHAGGRGAELVGEFIGAAEALVQGRGEGAGGFAALGSGRQSQPEERMIGVSAALITDRRTYSRRQRVELAQ